MARSQWNQNDNFIHYRILNFFFIFNHIVVETPKLGVSSFVNTLMERYRNKYRIQSTRLRNWDYSSNTAYFVTICTYGRHCFFGKIIDGKMELSEIGKLINQFWNEIPIHFPFVILDAFVVMPDHIHGIIVINKHPVETPKLGVSTIVPNLAETPKLGVSTKNPKWKPGTLGSIINQFKRVCTIHANKIDMNFAWQPRFYDNIIRNYDSYIKIKDYIINNPARWNEPVF